MWEMCSRGIGIRPGNGGQPGQRQHSTKFQLTGSGPFGLAAGGSPGSLLRPGLGGCNKAACRGGEPGVDSFLKALLPLSRRIDAVNTWIGKRLSWLILVAVFVSAANATVRKLFDTSSNSWLELQWVLFSIVFLLCSPWTLLSNEHIRIDIVNSMFPKWLRNTIEVVGHALFLLPLTLIMIVTGIPFFLRSWEVNEQSGNAGGLPQWPAKALVMIGFTLLLVQGVSELIKRIAIIRGLIPDPHEHQVHALEAEVEHIVEAIEKR
jgi:TRAP-type mannitol/chloroaromatic compound transport system permease small subunit